MNPCSISMTKQILILLFFATSIVSAQSTSTPAASPQSASTIQAKEEDVRSVEAILAATYDVISGPAGKKRDWDRFRSLFYPGARLIPTGKRPNESEVRARVLSPDDYVERSSPFLEREGFFERSVSNKIESSATSHRSSAPTSRVIMPATRSPFSAASTAFSSSTTASAGGS